MDSFELTPMQEAILADCLSGEGVNLYHTQRAFRIDTDLDEERLLRAWTTVLSRHQACRTSIAYEVGGSAEQIVHEAVRPDWEVQDHGDSAPEEWESILRAEMEQDRRRRIDLGRAPLMRWRLLRMRPNVHFLVWTHHHIMIDGWSSQMLLAEVSAAYQADHADQADQVVRASTAEDDRVQLGDYVRWLRGQDLDEPEEFWREMLRLPESGSLGSEARRGVSVASERLEPERLSPQDDAELRRVARDQQLTLPALFYAAWTVVLSTYTAQQTVTFGSVTSGRGSDLDGLEEAIGMFINVLPLRIRCTPDVAVLDLAREVQATMLDAQQYEYTPLRDILGWSERDRTGALFETVLSTGWSASTGEQDAEALFTPIRSHDPASYPMMVGIATGDGVAVTASFDPAVFERDFVIHVMRSYRTVLEAIARNSGALIRDLPRAPAQETERHLAEGGATPRGAVRASRVHDLVRAQADRTPDAVAISSDEGDLEYRELIRRADLIAHRLHAAGVRPETRVGLCAQRSPDMVAGFLGILVAGGVVVPLDPEYPPERIGYLLKDAEIERVLCQRRTRGVLNGYAGQFLWLDDVAGVPGTDATMAYESGGVPANLAYQAYTSGSTGRPKGTMVTHQAVCNVVSAFQEELRIVPGDRVLQSLPISFDVGISEVLQAICLGATLCLAPQGNQSGDALTGLLRERDITIASIPPSVLAATSNLDLPRLRLVSTGGEKVPQEVMDRWAAGRDFINQYGVSEATITSTVEHCRAGTRRIGIGFPIRNVGRYVLDDRMRPVPYGAAGELYLTGAGLQRGYHGRPGLTAERMLPDPYANEPGTRMYRTGDRVRLLPNGTMEYLSRLDQQLNVRGNRIEPSEVEAVLRSQPDIEEAVVLLDQGLLRGYVRSLASIDAERILAGLRETLPDVMVPVSLETVANWPTLPSGKVDREALPEYVGASAQVPEPVVAPRTDIERTLAEVWTEVLGLEQVGVNQNFFQLGGDSILAIQVVTRATRAGVTVSTRQVFRHQTIEELAAVAESPADQSPADQSPADRSAGGQGAGGRTAVEDAGTPQPGPASTAGEQSDEGPAVLTPMQHWFFGRGLDRPDEAYQSVRLEVSERITPTQLEHALNAVVERHDALRTRFLRADGGWQLRPVEKPMPLRLRRVGLDGVGESERESLVSREIAALGRGLDLASGELVGVELFERTDQPWLVVLVVHHIVMDGVSWRVLVDDLDLACRQLAAGDQVRLGAGTASYRQWSNRLARYAETEEVQAQREFWQDVADPRDPLPRDHADGTNEHGSEATVEVELDIEETTELLRDRPGVLEGSAHELLLASLGQAIGSWCGQPVVPVEVEMHGREPIAPDLDLTRTIGLFTAPFPVLVPARGADRVAALAELRERTSRAPYNGIGYGLLRYLSPNGEQLRHHAEIGFNYLGQWRKGNEQGQRVVRQLGALGIGTERNAARPYLFDVSAAVVDGKLKIHWEYSPNLHREQTVDAIARRHVDELRALLAVRTGGGPRRAKPADYPHATRLQQSELDLILQTGDVEDIYDLSPLQQGILVHSVMSPKEYCNQFSFRITGEIDLDRLEQAWHRAVDRNPALRSSVAHEGLGEPVQVVHRQAELRIRREDWRGSDPESIRRGMDELFASQLRTGLRITEAPPLLMAFVRTDETTAIIAITAHHIMLDRWSAELVLDDVLSEYSSLVRGERPRLRHRRQYREFIEWLAAQNIEAARAHWQHVLADARPCLAVPGTRRDSQGLSRLRDRSGGETLQRHITVDRSTTAGLRTVARTAGVTLNTVLQGAWALLLGEAGGGNDVVFGAATSGRPPELSGVEDMVGLFINTLPVRVRIDARTPLSGWLARLQEQQVESRQFDYAPLHEIRRWCGMANNLPLFRTLMAFENLATSSSESGDSDRVVEVASDARPAELNYPLALAIEPGESMVITLIYDQDLFERSDIDRLEQRFLSLLAEFSLEPETPVGQLARLDGSASPPGSALPADSALVDGSADSSDPFMEAGTDAGPMSRAELELADVWESVLGSRPADVGTSFYEAGGHSLLALRFANRANTLFGVEIPLGDLLLEPDIRSMAKLLTGEERRHGQRALVPIRTGAGATRPSLFGIHPGDGRVRCYRRLAQLLDEEQPVYGLQDVWADEGSWPWASLQEMAAAYVTEIETVEPEGPYQLIGYSFGGWLAFEIARQLREKGREVPTLAVVDSTVPGALRVGVEDEDVAYLAVFLQDLMEGRTLSSAELRDHLAPTETQSSLERLVTTMWPDSLQEQRAATRWLEQALRMFRREIALSRDYRIHGRYDGTVRLFRSEQRDEGLIRVDREIEEDPAAGWGQVSTEVEVIWLPGNHAEAMTGRSLDLLADRLTDGLRNQR